MKPISHYLTWPITEDLDAVLTNLHWQKKLDLSLALNSTGLLEKYDRETYQSPCPEVSEAPGESKEPPP
jgi:hypothetical protein